MEPVKCWALTESAVVLGKRIPAGARVILASDHDAALRERDERFAYERARLEIKLAQAEAYINELEGKLCPYVKSRDKGALSCQLAEEGLSVWAERWSKTNAEYERVSKALMKSESALAALREVLQALVTKLEHVHADLQYKAVWKLFTLHGRNYTGPQYETELERAQCILTAPDPGQRYREAMDCLKAILAADERGQGLPFKETMEWAARIVSKS